MAFVFNTGWLMIGDPVDDNSVDEKKLCLVVGEPGHALHLLRPSVLFDEDVMTSD